MFDGSMDATPKGPKDHGVEGSMGPALCPGSMDPALGAAAFARAWRVFR